jgi:hypothetical protein
VDLCNLLNPGEGLLVSTYCFVTIPSKLWLSIWSSHLHLDKIEQKKKIKAIVIFWSEITKSILSVQYDSGAYTRGGCCCVTDLALHVLKDFLCDFVSTTGWIICQSSLFSALRVYREQLYSQSSIPNQCSKFSFTQHPGLSIDGVD